jgi:hypothetical protein
MDPNPCVGGPFGVLPDKNGHLGDLMPSSQDIFIA